MAGVTARAPKQWSLEKKETINTFESWRQNLLYIFSLDRCFAPFLENNFTWQKQTAQNPTRGLTDDAAPIPEANRITAVQKNAHLELMLGQIANFCPVISRNTIVKNCTSLNGIWQKIREHYLFQSTGAHYLDLVNISFQADESHEDLFQRLMAFVEDNLLTSHCNLTHQGEAITTDEDMSPTLENTVVVLWLKLLHPGLPMLVKQRYGTELRNRTIASIKPEISQAIKSLLEELHNQEEGRISRSASFEPRQRQKSALPNRVNQIMYFV